MSQLIVAAAFSFLACGQVDAQPQPPAQFKPVGQQPASQQPYDAVYQALKIIELDKSSTGAGIAEQRLKAAIDMARETKQVNTEFKARFVLGLVYALISGDHRSANVQFGACTRLKPSDEAALNNLAVTEIRLRDPGAAVGAWKRAITSKTSPEILYNVKRFVDTSGKGMILPPPTSTVNKAATEAYADAVLLMDAKYAAAVAESYGWQYMPYVSGNEADDKFLVEAIGNFADADCTVCGGGQRGPCPTNCVNGKTPYTERVATGRNPQTGDTFYKIVKRYKPCITCSGTGLVDCRACRDGLAEDIPTKARSEITKRGG